MRNISSLLIHGVTHADVFKQFSLKVFLICSLDEVFSLHGEELPILLVKVLLDHADNWIVKSATKWHRFLAQFGRDQDLLALGQVEQKYFFSQADLFQ